jgi:hypothetical protein
MSEFDHGPNVREPFGGPNLVSEGYSRSPIGNPLPSDFGGLTMGECAHFRSARSTFHRLPFMSLFVKAAAPVMPIILLFGAQMAFVFGNFVQ